MTPLKHIPLIKADLPDLETVKDRFSEILESGRITNFGKHVAEFERASGEYLGAQAATVSSGTAGLILTLQALGLERDEKVIFPSFTFVATAQAVLYAGGVPLFAEIEEDMTLSPAALDRLLTENPDARFVIPVHMYGMPCRSDEIERIARRHAERRGKPVRVIYDAAHAFGSSRDGKRVGAGGDAEVFSLSVTKALTTVEGGLVTSRDEGLIQKIRTMRNYGLPPGTYNAVLPGLNSKMSEFHALIGVENLKWLADTLSRRAKNADYFKRGLAKIPFISLVPQDPGVIHTYKDFSVMVAPSLKDKRDKIMDFLKQNGIETRAYFYPPVHEQDFFKARFAVPSLPRTEDLSRRVISLPFYTSLTTDELDYMTGVLARAEEAVR